MKKRSPATPLSTNRHLLRWVEKMVELCKPDAIHWIDGSKEEYDELCAQMVAGGTFIKLNQKKWPGCFLARSDASDVARVEDRTFICALSKEAAGPTNNWVNPFEMRKTLKGIFNGCMKGRTMYVLPYSMGPLGSPMSQIGVQLTDSPYAVVNMRIMARIGKKVFELIDKDFKRVVALRPLRRRAARQGSKGCAVAVQQREIHRALPRDARNLELRFRLRRQRAARQEVFRPAHRFGDGPRRRLDGRAHAHPRRRKSAGRKNLRGRRLPKCLRQDQLRHAHSAPAFQSRAGRSWTVGDDIAWIKPDAEGRLRAINPEAGFFGVAPGTSDKTNPNAMKALAKNTIFTNVALTDDGGRLVGRHDRRAARRTPSTGRATIGPRARQGNGHQGRAPELPLHRARQAVPDHRPRLGEARRRADQRVYLRRPPRDHDAAGLPGVQLVAAASTWAPRWAPK